MIRTHNFSGDYTGTDCTSSCKSNYNTITTTFDKKINSKNSIEKN